MQGEELRSIRKALGWTQERLAAELGMTKTFIGMMERNDRQIEKRTALAVRYLALTGSEEEPAMVAVPRMKLGVQAPG